MAANGRTAIAFPGQGSFGPGMRESVERERPDLLELACQAVGEDPFARLGQGTRFDQPAILCASLAGFEQLGRPQPDFFAGHSLGEIGALAAAGAVAEADGMSLVAERGRLMQEAAQLVRGGMLAVRASRAEAAPLARSAGLALANDNAPDQVVLSGPEEALAEFEREAAERGLRAKRLAVAGPFHSSAMQAVVAPFSELLAGIEFAQPPVPVFSSVTAQPFDDPRRLLAEALVSPVRWLDVMRALEAAGVRSVIETGPGRVLVGLVRRSLDGVAAEAAQTLEAAGV
jgi:[acyl-carrier-protein] S-malonyltransferase